MSDGAPPPGRILETSLYASDLAAARAFYEGVLGLDVVLALEGRHVFFRCGRSMLLVFDPQTAERTPIAPDRAPPHGARGPGHVAFAVDEAELPRWRDRLERAGVPIESEVEWPRGGRSFYVRDPAGNSIEFVDGDIWGMPD